MRVKRLNSAVIITIAMIVGCIGGMLAATGIAVFLIPVTFYVVEKLAARSKKAGPTAPI